MQNIFVKSLFLNLFKASSSNENRNYCILMRRLVNGPKSVLDVAFIYILCFLDKHWLHVRYVFASSNTIMKNQCLFVMYFHVFFEDFYRNFMSHSSYFLAFFEFSDESLFLTF